MEGSEVLNPGNSESRSDTEQVNTISNDANAVRSVYIITYSQADMQRFPTREDFAAAVCQSFSQGPAKILHWCCCREKHAISGEHYHMAIKLEQNQRWIHSKVFLNEIYNISVHYSNSHCNYYSAWEYVTKEDSDYIQSERHPRLAQERQPRTTRASRARQTRSRSRRCNAADQGSQGGSQDTPPSRARRGEKKKRMSGFEVAEIVVKENIKTLLELQSLAAEQKKEGKTDLAEFLINRTPRAVSDILQSAWEIERAPSTLERLKKTRFELLLEARNSPCHEGCNGKWLTCAQQILTNNGISRQFFSNKVQDLLQRGRGKYRNLMIIGPANCGKTFLLNPLTSIYNTFCNPATGSFAWIGVDKSECIFLNDFRWSPQLIPWQDLLLLLEGHVVHFPAPKTHFAKDIAFDMDTPIFSTSKNALVYIKNGMIDERETEMMRVRWTVIHLNHQIPRDSQCEVPPCGKCFSELIIG